jgi:multiple sugar transport system ATP-binding protein
LARVRLEKVVKRYGRVLAVDHVDLDIRDKEFFTLLGPSGCGKTTTLRLIAGLEFPDEGFIYIDDRVVNDVHPKDRDVAMVFQNYALYPHLTVYENIAFPLETRRKTLGLTKEDIRKVVLETARFLGIEELLDRYPSQLSGGQQQRVALARALVRKPKVWLLDEPLSNLDAKLRVLMRSELKRVQRILGITTIYVTHDQVEAMSMADRIAVMNKGRVVQVGTPDELYSKPSDTFVATFIGSPPMNLIPCTVVEKDVVEYTVPENYEGGILGSGRIKTRYVLECSEGLSIPLDPIIGGKLTSEGELEVYLGVRPEDTVVSKELKASIGSIKSRVEVVEPLGSETILNIKIGDELLKVKQPPGALFQPGELVYLEFNLRKALLFSRRSGRLLA